MTYCIWYSLIRIRYIYYLLYILFTMHYPIYWWICDVRMIFCPGPWPGPMARARGVSGWRVGFGSEHHCGHYCGPHLFHIIYAWFPYDLFMHTCDKSICFLPHLFHVIYDIIDDWFYDFHKVFTYVLRPFGFDVSDNSTCFCVFVCVGFVLVCLFQPPLPQVQ